MTPLNAFLSGDGLSGSLSSAGIALGILSADRQAPTVANPSIATNVAQAGNVLADLSTKLPLDDVRAVQDAGNA